MLRSLGALLTKNLSLKRRRYIATAFELILPLILFLGIIYLRNNTLGFTGPYESSKESEDQHDHKSALRRVEDPLSCTGNGVFYLATDKSELVGFTQELAIRLNGSVTKMCDDRTDEEFYRPNFFLVLENSESLEKVLEASASENIFESEPNRVRVLGGAVVNHVDDLELDYTLRFAYSSDYSIERVDTGEIYNEQLFDVYFSRYYSEPNFQALIDLHFVQWSLGPEREEELLPWNNTDWNDIKIKWTTSSKSLPFWRVYKSSVAELISFFLVLAVASAFMPLIPIYLKGVVVEKNSGVKEFLKMNGVSLSTYWLSWFLTSFISVLISSVLVSTLLCIHFGEYAILEKTSIVLVFISFLIYLINFLALNFFLSSLFNSPNIALTVGVMFHVISFFVPALALESSFPTFPIFVQLLLLVLCPNVSLWRILVGFFELESVAKGMDLSNLSDGLTGSDDNFSVLMVWAIMVGSTLLFWIVMIYVDNVRPGPFGVARPLYFFLLPSYYCGDESSSSVSPEPLELPVRNNKLFESEPSDLKRGLEVRNLQKIFTSLFSDNKVHAVNNATFSCFENEITALLGHNGAGKTTTMAIISGLLSPSGGKAFVNGLDITKDMSAIRRQLGLCPQHNMLFEGLTVKEHLRVYGMLRGLSWSSATRDAISVATQVMLGEKLDTPSRALSGGMKRKLHLGIALIGNARVVLLDEPTSGLDPEARREIWDVLQRMKAERTVVLTTHFMEEADALGDRIAIMADGAVQCYGTPHFLKKAMGSGYRLTVSKESDRDSDSLVKHFVKDIIPSATVLSSSLSQFTMNLPVSEEGKFAILLKKLAESKQELGIGGFGLAVTSLEDVFLKVGSNELDMDAIDDRLENENEANENNVVEQEDERKKGLALWLLQLVALIKKRFAESLSSWILLFIMAILTVALTLSTALISNYALGSNKGDGYQPPALYMSLKDYNEPKTLIGPLGEDALDSIIRQFLRENNDKVKFETTDDIEDTTLVQTEKLDDEEAARFIILGLETSEVSLESTNIPSVKVYFNMATIHGEPLAITVGSNVLFRLLSGQEKASIKTAYHPINAANSDLSKFGNRDLNVLGTGMLYSIFVNLGLFLFLSIFFNYPLRERKANAKQVQIMAGVHPWLYWLGFFVFDFVFFLIIATIITAGLTIIDETGLFMYNLGFLYFFLFIAVFGAGFMLHVYAQSMVFGSIPAGYVVFICELVFLGIVVPMALVTMLLALKDANLKVWFVLFSYTPFAPLGRGLSKLTEIQSGNAYCESAVSKETLTELCKSTQSSPSSLFNSAVKQMSECCSTDYVDKAVAICGKSFNLPDGNSISAEDCHQIQPVFSFDLRKGVSFDLTLLLLNIVLQALFLAGMESGYLQRAWKRVKNALCSGPSSMRAPNALMDEDVSKEQQLAHRAVSNADTSFALVASGLTKSFGRFMAVDNLGFTVRPGECFGLLGVNGAGKTTSFRMLTGDEQIDSGKALLENYSIAKQKRNFLMRIGYCPQFDSIINVLTGRQIIELMASIRGVPSQRRGTEVDKWIKFVGIEKYADKKCGTYSGGNKRKLNVAQALVGDPPVILMDEPSTGVDPAARRRLWKAIMGIKKQGQAVVLTSHSMDECEYLCDRLGIMVNGQFRCMGGPQHLKNKFGKGFTVAFHINGDNADLKESEEFNPKKSKKVKRNNSLVSDNGNNNDGYVGDEEHERGVEHVIAFMNEAFQDKCVLRERQRGLLSFHIGDPRLPWHELLEKLQEAKRSMSIIQDYSLGETTLEEIFLHFAGNQRYQ